jgi:hypothetical protein
MRRWKHDVFRFKDNLALAVVDASNIGELVARTVVRLGPPWPRLLDLQSTQPLYPIKLIAIFQPARRPVKGEERVPTALATVPFTGHSTAAVHHT